MWEYDAVSLTGDNVCNNNRAQGAAYEVLFSLQESAYEQTLGTTRGHRTTKVTAWSCATGFWLTPQNVFLLYPIRQTIWQCVDIFGWIFLVNSFITKGMLVDRKRDITGASQRKYGSWGPGGAHKQKTLPHYSQSKVQPLMTWEDHTCCLLGEPAFLWYI